jgi:hypothetical protein
MEHFPTPILLYSYTPILLYSYTLILASMLLQPFEEFKPTYLPRLIQLGRRYLVSQTYIRAKEVETDPYSSRVNLLLSDYVQPGEAKLHLNAIKKDRYAAIIDLERPPHLNRVREILMEGSGYRVFFAVVRNAKELESEINKRYKEKLKQYVDKQTNWKISRDTIVKPSLQLSFGELFIILKHGSQTIRIKFEEIE